MQRRGAAIAALAIGAAAVVLIIVLSSGGDGDDKGQNVSAPKSERDGGAPGSSGSESTDSQAAGGQRGANGGGTDTTGARRHRSGVGAPDSQTGGSPAGRTNEGQSGGQSGGADAPQGAPPVLGSPERRRPGATVYTLVLRGGGPVGGAPRIRFPKDKRVRLIIESDSDEVVQIPDYDITRRVRANRGTRIYFETTRTGLHEIELVRGRTRIAVLAVD
jgi:hypothetical protein